MSEYKFGYFLNLKNGEQYSGGMMVTDAASVPVEFKYTEPIKPTKIHRIIFGQVLDKYINEEVIKKSLMKELKNHPSLIFVKDAQLLKEPFTRDVPVIMLQKTTLGALGDAGEFKRISGNNRDLLVQPVSSTSPLKVTFSTIEPDVQERVIAILRTVLMTVDIFEPFSRVETALKAICQDKN